MIGRMSLSVGLLLGAGALVAGCSGGGGGGGFGPGSGSAPVGSATWDAFYTSNPSVQGDAVTALTGVPSGHLLVGQASAQLYRVDSNSIAALESSFSAGVGSLADLGSSIWAGTGDPLFAPNALTPGQVLQRGDAGTWTVALDYPESDVVVAAIGSELYAFASPTAAVGSASASASRLANGIWMQDVANLGSSVITAASAYDGWMWAAGHNDAGPLLLRGSMALAPASGFNPVALPITPAATEIATVTDLLAIDTDLYVAVLCADAVNPSIVTRGEVLFTSDGQTFFSVGSFVNDAPRALGWHEDTLYVGLDSGDLQSFQSALVPVEPAILPNMGVHSIASVDSNTLLVGVQGNSGAEILRRTLTTPSSPDPIVVVDPQNPGAGTPGTPGTPPQVAQLSYLGSVKAILNSNCAVCHTDPNNPANAGFALSAGLVDDQADYNAVLARVKVGGGVNGSLLLRKSTGRSPHGGGEALVSGSPEHQTIVQWLSDGAAFQ